MKTDSREAKDAIRDEGGVSADACANVPGPGEKLLSASWFGDAIRFERSGWSSAQESRRSSDASFHRIMVVESGGTRRTTIRIDGLQVYRGRDWPEALSFVPAGVERSGSYDDADLVYSALRIDPAIASSLLDEGRHRRLSPFTNGSDPVIASLLGTLGADLSQGTPPSAAYVEHLVALVLLRLDRAGQDTGEIRRHRPLDSASLKGIEEYIQAHLGEDIAVATLAALCSMRPDTFARRFRAATGKAPYAHVLGRRIERAQVLLRATSVDIAAVALDLGFSNQSHLTTVFRSIVGVTPARYRAQFRPIS